jgi:hypothetical protein
MEPMVKEFHEYVESLGNMPFDKALPLMRKEMWRIAEKYNTTGDKVFMKYMDWKSSQKK